MSLHASMHSADLHDSNLRPHSVVIILLCLFVCKQVHLLNACVSARTCVCCVLVHYPDRSVLLSGVMSLSGGTWIVHQS